MSERLGDNLTQDTVYTGMPPCLHVVHSGGRGCSCREVDARIAELEAALAAANRPPLRIECPDCGDVLVISRVGETVYCQCPGSRWSIQERKENADA